MATDNPAVLNDSILNSLRAIQEQADQWNRVEFLFQPWTEFNNFGIDGFRIKAIQNPVIPRLSLIPIVQYGGHHIDSHKNPNTDKYAPVKVPYSHSIEATYLDCLQRYGRYGLVKLDAITCRLEQVERYAKIFETLMFPYMKDGLLQDLCTYFGAESPVEDLFEEPQTRVQDTYESVLDAMAKEQFISQEEYAKFKAILPVLAASAKTAHRMALMPSVGVLPQSIEEINDRRKAKFDDLDTFLRREFPEYNSDTNVSKRPKKSEENTGLADLTNLMGQFVKTVTAMQSGQKVETQELLDAAKQATESVAETEENNDPPVLDTPAKCKGVTRENRPCKLEGMPTLEFPDYCPAHQEQGRKAAASSESPEAATV